MRSCQTRTCPSQPGPAPMPITGIDSAAVTWAASSAWTTSSTLANAPALLPGLLARYGVRADGQPLSGGAAGPGRLRAAVRTSARTMYRHGAEVVAPALRKLAAI